MGPRSFSFLSWEGKGSRPPKAFPIGRAEAEAAKEQLFSLLGDTERLMHVHPVKCVTIRHAHACLAGKSLTANERRHDGGGAEASRDGTRAVCIVCAYIYLCTNLHGSRVWWCIVPTRVSTAWPTSVTARDGVEKAGRAPQIPPRLLGRR